MEHQRKESSECPTLNIYLVSPHGSGATSFIYRYINKGFTSDNIKINNLGFV